MLRHKAGDGPRRFLDFDVSASLSPNVNENRTTAIGGGFSIKSNGHSII
jgi:hypothetical protein